MFLAGVFSLLVAASPCECPTQTQPIVHVTPFHDSSLVNLFREKEIRLIVIRHGEGIHNLTETMTSSRSPGVYLTEKGIAQVKIAAEEMRQYNVDTMYISPVFRTMQTAQILGERLSVPYPKMIIEDRLREQYFGDLENQTYDEYRAHFSSKEQMYYLAVPNGESGKELFQRTHDFLWEIASLHSQTTILLVTHAFNCCQISQCLTGSFQDIPEQARPKIYDFSTN